MAYNLLSALKTSVVASLAEIMPNDVEGNPIPVGYAWPGEQHQAITHVWLANGTTRSVPSTMRAGRKRRDQTITFDIIIECRLTGATVDDNGVNVLQQVADEQVETVAGVIDEWIADNPTLGQTEAADLPVDYATFDSFTLTHGPLATGVAAVGVCVVSVRTRPL